MFEKKKRFVFVGEVDSEVVVFVVCVCTCTNIMIMIIIITCVCVSVAQTAAAALVSASEPPARPAHILLASETNSLDYLFKSLFTAS